METISKGTCICLKNQAKVCISGMKKKKIKCNIEDNSKKMALKDSLLSNLRVDKFMKAK